MNRIEKMIDGEMVAIKTDVLKKTKPETHLQKFRRQNPRFDYYAMPDAAAAIERLRQLHPDASKRQAIDMLVEEGVKAFFPESRRDAVNSDPE